MNHSSPSHVDLQAAARQIMLQNGFEPDFPPEVQQQVAAIEKQPPGREASAQIRDLRQLLWSSIDNDTSRDLDQIEVAEKLANGSVRIMVGIADVDAFVPQASPIDLHAGKETTSVYTGVRTFPMLPEALCNGITSLLESGDNLSVVIEFTVDQQGQVTGRQLYPALVRNKAQLTYNSVGPWLEGKGDPPQKVADSRELQAQLKLQDQAAQALKTSRHRNGALDIDTDEVSPVMLNGQITDLVKQEKNRATELIEDFMVAANGTVATVLGENEISSIRRVVKTPERWDRIVTLAAQHGTKLPGEPDSKALNVFLSAQKAADPDHFADLSLAVIKLMGPGEYVLERPGEPSAGHFGLAVQNYTHSTAPNRRFADVVTQRLIKSFLAKRSTPYSDEDLSAIARNCTLKEDAARKVERAMRKRIAAVSMSSRIGQTFDAIVTGNNDKGTFVRVLKPHVEGMLMNAHGVDVGDKLRVRLINTDAQRGYIDFQRT